MSRIVHISQFNPFKHEGGVAQFARDLREAIGNLHFLYHDNKGMAEAINKRYLSDGYILPSDTVIADGYYGLGLAGKVERLIVVCHSTYMGWLRDNLMMPHPGLEGSIEWLTKAAIAQAVAYTEADQLVAVSSSAAEELWDFYQLDSKVIFNGIDVDRFQPSQNILPETIVEVAGKDLNKGADIIGQLVMKAGLKIDPLGFGGKKEKRWETFEIALLPSRHEGGSYAQLEAMATNKKCAALRSGYFKHDVPRNLFFGTDDLYWRTFADLIDDAIRSDPPAARGWVVENATIEKFNKEWSVFLRS